MNFHSSILSSERSDRLISDQDAYIAHLFYIAQELKKKVAQYSPGITVNAMFAFIARYRSSDPPAVSVF